jgi:hypothetical protein
VEAERLGRKHRVREIVRTNKTPRKVLVKVSWYYRPEDTIAGAKVGHTPPALPTSYRAHVPTSQAESKRLDLRSPPLSIPAARTTSHTADSPPATLS